MSVYKFKPGDKVVRIGGTLKGTVVKSRFAGKTILCKGWRELVRVKSSTSGQATDIAASLLRLDTQAEGQ